jgi:hypothetical protein
MHLLITILGFGNAVKVGFPELCKRSFLTVLKRRSAPARGASSSRWVDLVGEDVVCLGPGDGEIQTGKQLQQGFPFSPYQHRQGICSLMGDSNTVANGRDDPDTDSALFDYLSEVRQVWETACG